MRNAPFHTECRKCGVDLDKREIMQGEVVVFEGTPVLDLGCLCAICRGDELRKSHLTMATSSVSRRYSQGM